MTTPVLHGQVVRRLLIVAVRDGDGSVLGNLGRLLGNGDAQNSVFEAGFEVRQVDGFGQDDGSGEAAVDALTDERSTVGVGGDGVIGVAGVLFGIGGDSLARVVLGSDFSRDGQSSTSFVDVELDVVLGYAGELSAQLVLVALLVKINLWSEVVGQEATSGGAASGMVLAAGPEVVQDGQVSVVSWMVASKGSCAARVGWLIVVDGATSLRDGVEETKGWEDGVVKENWSEERHRGVLFKVARVLSSCGNRVCCGVLWMFGERDWGGVRRPGRPDIYPSLAAWSSRAPWAPLLTALILL